MTFQILNLKAVDQSNMIYIVTSWSIGDRVMAAVFKYKPSLPDTTGHVMFKVDDRLYENLPEMGFLDFQGEDPLEVMNLLIETQNLYSDMI
jgi:hypothetical protein